MQVALDRGGVPLRLRRRVLACLAARVAAPQQIPGLVELDLEVAESLALGVVQPLPDVSLPELVLPVLDQRIDAFAQRVVRHQVTSRSSC